MDIELLNRVKRELKSGSWNNRQKYLAQNPGGKFLSTYKINAALEEPKDWNQIAADCSNNPNHEYFGETAEFILAEWKSRGAKGKDRGNTLDDYITAKLEGKSFDFSECDKETINKCSFFDETYDKFFKDFMYVGSEIWVNSEKGISGRMDTVFIAESKKTPGKYVLLIAEWKNTEKLTDSNKWSNLLGPAKHLEQSELNKFTNQVYIYKYILENELNIDIDVDVRIFQYKKDGYKIWKPGFEYSKQYIEDIIEYAKKC